MLKKLEAFKPGEKADLEAQGAKWRANTASATCGWVVRHTDSILKVIAEHIHDLREAVEELEAKTALAEEKALRYCGVHDKGQQYNPGDCVTAKGGLWFCEKPTRGVPGAPNSGFRLMHKTPAARGNRT